MGNYVWPCPYYSRVTSPFTYRVSPITGAKEQHLGVDLACPAGKPIIAAREGTVKEAKFHKSYGNYVLLDHGDGLQTRYAHSSKLLVSAGEQVNAGDQIALVGSTGDSTGPHLHFEIIVAGSYKNPLDYVSDRDTLENYTSQSRKTGTAGASGGGSGGGSGNGGNGGDGSGGDKEITDVTVKSFLGSYMTAERFDLLEKKVPNQTGCEIIIQNDKYYYPLIKDEIVWETERVGTPGKLTFSVVKDGVLNFQEGNPVRFRANNKDVFFGYVFSKKRSNQDFISVTCYDQLRYLKNKHTMKYEPMKYSDLLRTIAAGYELNCGTIEDTEYVLPSRLEEASLFDILGNASDITMMNTGKIYVLFDDFGKLSLRFIENMITDIMIDQDVACEYDYTSSIDSNTYNKIMLAYDNKQTGKRELTVEQDGENQNKWGILQYYQKINDSTNNPQEMAKELLKFYNQKTRNLSISKILGNVQVRAGSSVMVNMGLGDINVSNKMLVEKAKHTFSHGEHFMDLTLRGIKWGGFVV